MHILPLSVLCKGWFPFFKEEWLIISIWFISVSVFVFFLNILSVKFAAFLSVELAILLLIFLILFRKFCAGGFCCNDNGLAGQTIIITGSNTGIGKETAIELARRGANLILACRDVKKADAVASKIRETTSSVVVVEKLDLASFDYIRNFANKIISNYSEIHCLINNAGIMMCPYQKTQDGLEMQIGVNHFGHFLLTKLLLPLLTKGHPARIINVSSVGHYPGVIPFGDFAYEKGYNRMQSYLNSKLANVLHIRQLAKILKGTNVQVFALHPGAVQSELGRHLPLAFIFANCQQFFTKTTFEGAQNTVFCATEAVQQSPYYYSDCELCVPSALAMCDETAEKLWKVSEEAVNSTKE